MKCSPGAFITLTKPLQEHHSHYHRCFEFLDDYRLAVSVSASEDNESPVLLLLDTERVSLMEPTWTRFCGPAPCLHWTCLFDTGGHKPSPQEMLAAPFYPDPSQRILALSTELQWGFYVMKVETLLRLVRERAGEDIQWEEWKSYMIETVPQRQPHTAYHRGSWVSGFRLFSTFVALCDRGCNLCVHDFSPHASTKFLHKLDDGRTVMRPSVESVLLPWNGICIRSLSFGHDSIVAELVSRFPPPQQLVAQ